MLHKLMRKTLTQRIGYLKTIPTYERNLLNALINHVHFDAFEYIIDEIWNIATNTLRSCGSAPYIQCMIEVVAHEKFYKDVAHEPLHPAVPKDPLTHCASSSAPAVPPFHTTRSGGSSSASSSISGFLKMFIGILTICHHTDQLAVMEQCLQIVQRNQEIIHSQRDKPLLEFLDIPVFPPIPDPYASLTPTELAAFSIGPTCVSDDDDKKQADDDEETEDDE
jgi:hypothetical protein